MWPCETGGDLGRKHARVGPWKRRIKQQQQMVDARTCHRTDWKINAPACTSTKPVVGLEDGGAQAPPSAGALCIEGSFYGGNVRPLIVAEGQPNLRPASLR
jgi:hypothetical protein